MFWLKRMADKTDSVLLSIIIPTYNYGHLLPRVIESILSQKLPEDVDSSYQRIEIIVVDDGSTDNTPEVIESLIKTKNESAFLPLFYLWQENAGAGSARNFGLHQSKGDYIYFLDADDELLPGTLTSIIEAIQSNPLATVYLGGNISVQTNGREKTQIPSEQLAPESDVRLKDYLLRKRLKINHGNLVASRDLLLKRPYAEELKTREDIPVFAFLVCFGKIATIPTPWVKIHKHPDSLRHTPTPSEQKSTLLVDEVFSALPDSCQYLLRHYAAQRYASLFRNYAENGDKKLAWYFYRETFKKSIKESLHWPNIRRLFLLCL